LSLDARKKKEKRGRDFGEEKRPGMPGRKEEGGENRTMKGKGAQFRNRIIQREGRRSWVPFAGDARFEPTLGVPRELRNSR